MNSQSKSDSVNDNSSNDDKAVIQQRFRCLSLYEVEQSQAVLLNKLVTKCKYGVHDFYPHSSELSENKAYRETFYQALKKSGGINDNGLNGWEWHQNTYTPETNQLMRLVYQTNIHQFHEIVSAYYQKLRAALYEQNKFDRAMSFNVCQATCWDLFTNRNEQSSIIIDEKHGEYLVWNDANLWTNDEWEKKIEVEDKTKDRLAWQGSSWFGHMMHLFYQKQNSADMLEDFPEALSEILFTKTEILAQYHQGLSDYYQSQGKENQLLNPKPWQSYIACLCEFLPSYEYEDMLLPVHTAGGSGGPMLWRGILDGHIHMLMRQLLMDGWLCLWPDEKGDNLYIHPSSLAILYWAARHARKPHTSTPRDFIKSYDWNNKWFGGHIEKINL